MTNNEELKKEGEPLEHPEHPEVHKIPPHKDKKKKNEKEEELMKEIEQLKGENAALKNDFARAYADTENMKKRLRNEAELAGKYRIQSFATEILPALDNLERALSTPPTAETESYRKGVEMIYQQIRRALNDEGVSEIEAEGKPFDPNVHQAIMTGKEEGIEPGMVLQVLQKGYMLKDRILRASMVKVSE